LVLLVVALSGATDLLTGKIYNVVTYPAVAAGFVGSLLGLGPSWSTSAVGMLVGFSVFFALYSVGWMGGGDVKLMAAVGAAKGFPFILHAMFYSIFLGGLFALLALIWKKQLVATLRQIRVRVHEVVMPGAERTPLENLGGSIPFGFAICWGTLTAMAFEAVSRTRGF